MKRTTAISIFCLALLCGFASVPTAQAAAPLIVSAIVNSPAGQITISGKRLAPATRIADGGPGRNAAHAGFRQRYPDRG